MKRGVLDALDASARALLDQHALRERQKVLAIRAQLRELSLLADRQGWSLLVLKGGAAALRRPVETADLDLLAAPETAHVLAAMLDAAGYTAGGSGAERHLQPRTAPHALPIEIHTNLDPLFPHLDDLWRRARPIGAHPGLFEMHPADQLEHLLHHTTVDHPDRRGRIRDLLVIHDAAERIEPGHAARSGATNMETLLLESATALGRLADHDPFQSWRRDVLTACEIARRFPGPAIFRGDVARWALAWRLDWKARRRAFNIRRETLGPSSMRAIATLERGLPPLGRAVRTSIRAVRQSTAALAGLVVAGMMGTPATKR